ncbi:MAG: LysR substrate-binding domain-containing protein, partial [Ectothiorhodospiraceae bacterium]|jgi:DNA-binding transcriptional LysR family regulator
MQNLPTDLLRAFVTVADLGSFTSAGEVLGRSQPAVSLQIKRLEEVAGVTLLERSGRSLRPTAEGDILLRYGREMLSLNDEAIARLSGSTLVGTVRLGIPNEFASSFLPEILGKFAQSHPDVAVEVTCALSTDLIAAQERHELDLVFGLHSDAADDLHSEGWTEELAWVASPKHRPHMKTPLPLIVAPRGCVYRGRILDVLEQRRTPWRIIYSSPSFGGIRAGVMAGLGVTVLSRSIVPEGLRTLPTGDRLPALEPIRVQLHYDRERASEAVRGLAEYMASNLGQRRQEPRRTGRDR